MARQLVRSDPSIAATKFLLQITLSYCEHKWKEVPPSARSRSLVIVKQNFLNVRTKSYFAYRIVSTLFELKCESKIKPRTEIEALLLNFRNNEGKPYVIEIRRILPQLRLHLCLGFSLSCEILRRIFLSVQYSIQIHISTSNGMWNSRQCIAIWRHITWGLLRMLYVHSSMSKLYLLFRFITGMNFWIR